MKNPQQITENPNQLLRARTVFEMVGIGRTSLYAKLKKGEFPKPIRVGTTVRWLMADILAYIEKLVADTRANSSSRATV
ncbi:MAG: AlpA family phage regulatory protein [Candidatus Ozemobacteraceae bacterium]